MGNTARHTATSLKSQHPSQINKGTEKFYNKVIYLTIFYPSLSQTFDKGAFMNFFPQRETLQRPAFPKARSVAHSSCTPFKPSTLTSTGDFDAHRHLRVSRPVMLEHHGELCHRTVREGPTARVHAVYVLCVHGTSMERGMEGLAGSQQKESLGEGRVERTRTYFP